MDMNTALKLAAAVYEVTPTQHPFPRPEEWDICKAEEREVPLTYGILMAAARRHLAYCRVYDRASGALHPTDCSAVERGLEAAISRFSSWGELYSGLDTIFDITTQSGLANWSVAGRVVKKALAAYGAELHWRRGLKTVAHPAGPHWLIGPTDWGHGAFVLSEERVAQAEAEVRRALAIAEDTQMRACEQISAARGY